MMPVTLYNTFVEVFDFEQFLEKMNVGQIAWLFQCPPLRKQCALAKEDAVDLSVCRGMMQFVLHPKK